MRRKAVYREYQSSGRGYSCLGFIFDVLMVCITGGLWLIWIFVREMRKR